ncbi:hypothetical protein Bind_1799 [Beijerinckia indica subsp. indica ATCC 9039]|uniref:Glycosyltransferase RgtA/B/C/D-like domain-containing protein n=1 Tax=Beijerinckia indica subsp. indica (strain ATCC 9039 / DSM 1715 / NCIMB 8712) TaxID=395963 RepID=B2IDJ1_BEII9|nr:hypothetical protein Bind_1799 [Beijerinckia indica subsp. indica ATCC 9039]
MNVIQRNIHIALAIFISFCLIFYIRLGLPIPARDSSSFLPTALWIAKGLDWLNPLAPHLDLTRPDNSIPRFVYHGWLYPYLIGIASPSADWMSLFLTNSLFIAAEALIYAVLLKYATHSPLLLVSAVLIFFLSILSFSYRPDVIATFLIFLIAFVRLHSASTNPLLPGFLFALLFLSQPNSCLIVAPVYAALEFERQKPKQALTTLAFVGAIAFALIALAFFFFYPFPIADWISGIVSQAAYFSQRKEYFSFVKFLVADPEFPLLIVFMAISGLFVLTKLFTNKPRTVTVFSRLLIALTVSYMFFTAIRVPPANYNIIQFVPAMTYYMVYSIDRYRPQAKWFWLSLTAFVVIFGVVAAFNLSRKLVQTIVSAQDPAASYGQSAARIATVLSACPDVAAAFNVAFSMTTIEQMTKTHFIRDLSEMNDHSYDAYVTTLNGTSSVPAIESFEVIYANENAGIRLLGVPLSNSRNAYGLAILLNKDNHCDKAHLQTLAAKE